MAEVKIRLSTSKLVGCARSIGIGGFQEAGTNRGSVSPERHGEHARQRDRAAVTAAENEQSEPGNEKASAHVARRRRGVHAGGVPHFMRHLGMRLGSTAATYRPFPPLDFA